MRLYGTSGRGHCSLYFGSFLISSIWPGSSTVAPFLMRYSPASSGSSYLTLPRLADGIEPGDHTVSKWLSGAPHGCVNLPTRGDFGSFRSDGAPPHSLP